MRSEHVIERHGKQYVLYSGLLEEAHAQGLAGIDTVLLQVPTESNGMVAIARAVVVMDPDEDPQDRRRFTGIGDASPDNVARNIQPHLIRMAETRAKARALRDAINAPEALLDDGEVDSGGASQDVAPQARRSQPRRSDKEITVSEGEIEKLRGETAVIGHPSRARKHQIDLLKTLAVEWRGENGVERLESRIGKSLEDLTIPEADEWIDRLTPEQAR